MILMYSISPTMMTEVNVSVTVEISATLNSREIEYVLENLKGDDFPS